MTSRVRLIALACALVLSLGAMRVSAAVDWTDSLDDPSGDVLLDFSTPVTGMGAIDIRHVETEVEGANVNVTLQLAASYNASASYSVELKGDGSKDFSFSRMMFVGYMATDPSGGLLLNVSGGESTDGRTIHWTLPQADFKLTTKLEIDSASAVLIDMTNISDVKTYMDSAGSASPPPPPPDDDDDEAGPMRIEFTYEIVKVNSIKQTVVMYFSGNQTKYLRKAMDTNEDGTVTAAERDKYIDEMEKMMGNDTLSSNITLDGMAQTSSTFVLESPPEVLGSVNSTSTIPLRMSTTIGFPEPDGKKKTHEYRYVQGGSGTSGFENVTNDSLMRFLAPSGWRFDKAGWPASVVPFISKDGTKIEIKGKDWDTAFPPGTNITAFTIVEKKKADDSPGAGAVLAVTAAALAAVVVLSRRRGLAR